ncbi:class I SAM-dependent methyltransferase [Clostridium sp. DL1XJH146]
MSKKHTKFENAERVRELDIQNTLNKALITSNDLVCDYGAGTGIFTVEAAKITENKVLAMDISIEMLEIINEKATKESLTNVETIKVEKDSIECEDSAVDLFMLVTVLHEIKDIPKFIIEIKRILKEKGRVMVVDFKKKDTPMGPPASHRLSSDEATGYFLKENILLSKEYDLGDNFYMLILENNNM